jgi:hypothetical protein
MMRTTTDDFVPFPPWKHAVKKLLDGGLTYGNTVTREQISELCNIAPPTSIGDVRRYDLELLRNTHEIKEMLLVSHSMLLAADGAGGYLVIAPMDQTKHAVETGARAISKELKRMATGVTFVRTDLLDDDARAKNADAMAKISSLHTMLAKKELLKIAID